MSQRAALGVLAAQEQRTTVTNSGAPANVYDNRLQAVSAGERTKKADRRRPGNNTHKASAMLSISLVCTYSLRIGNTMKFIFKEAC
jgi:hypothetical protein